MPGANGVSTSWRQTSLYPQTLIQVRLDVGWSSPNRVGMFSAEAYVPTSRELLALEVHPSARYDSLVQFLTHAQTWQGQVLLDLFDPDPF